MKKPDTLTHEFINEQGEHIMFEIPYTVLGDPSVMIIESHVEFEIKDSIENYRPALDWEESLIYVEEMKANGTKAKIDEMFAQAIKEIVVNDISVVYIN